MAKHDKLRQITDLIFTMRNLTHEKLSQTHKSVSFLQLIALKFIHEKKPFMKDISEYLSITPPSATSIISSLIKTELVKREVGTKDKRSTKIIITKKGERYLKKFTEKIIDRMSKNLSVLNSVEQGQLIKILEKIIKTQK